MIFFESTNCFSSFVCQTTTVPTDIVLSFQKKLNVHVIALERGDFKLSIGSVNNKHPYTVKVLLNMLQLSLCLQSRNFNMAANGNEECKAKSYEPKLEKKTKQQ